MVLMTPLRSAELQGSPGLKGLSRLVSSMVRLGLGLGLGESGG
jgi:hypothetical protein